MEGPMRGQGPQGSRIRHFPSLFYPRDPSRLSPHTPPQPALGPSPGGHTTSGVLPISVPGNIPWIGYRENVGIHGGAIAGGAAEGAGLLLCPSGNAPDFRIKMQSFRNWKNPKLQKGENSQEKSGF